jgi:hypothetical protein
MHRVLHGVPVPRTLHDVTKPSVGGDSDDFTILLSDENTLVFGEPTQNALMRIGLLSPFNRGGGQERVQD